MPEGARRSCRRDAQSGLSLQAALLMALLDQPIQPSRTEDSQVARRNFWAWVLYQLCYRIGWQFKMESTMIAGLVSYLSPSAAVMGRFTTVSNVGRCVAPAL